MYFRKKPAVTLTERQTPEAKLSTCPRCGGDIEAVYEWRKAHKQHVSIGRDKHGALVVDYVGDDTPIGDGEAGEDYSYQCDSCDGEWGTIYDLDHARRVIAAAQEEHDHFERRAERLSLVAQDGRVDAGALGYDPIVYAEGQRDAYASITVFLREQL